MSRSSARDTDIAIVGMACLFPGAPDLDAYWRNILAGVDAVTEPPPEAWDTDVYYDPAFADVDKVYCQRGGYLGDLAAFDPLAHGIPPVTVGGEPDQWLALQVAHDALRDAGALDLDPAVRARTGIVLGKGTYLNGGNAIAVQRALIVEQTLAVLRQVHPEHTDEDIARLRQAMKEALPPIGPETVGGLIPNIIVGRIANRLDLMGPAYTVDAACASSLVAVELAQRHLLDGDCDLVLAGGSQVWMPVPTLNVFSHLGALSRRGQIRPFDADADGTLLGEGIGMVVLKRAADAERDGDRVYAVVKAVGVASDGRGASVMAPRVEGEAAALRRAYERAGIDPTTIGLLEAHGTATAVGDAVELEALHEVVGRRRGELPTCALGTVKSMISHTIPASGVAGIIKVALALHHRVLPPTLHCEQPNPRLGWDTSPFYVNTATRPWIHGGAEPRRAGVNAFGFGGINAHAILEEVPDDGRLDHLPPWDSELVVLEASDAGGLAARARALAARLDGPSPGVTLADVAAGSAAALGGLAAPVRLAAVATSLDDLRAKLDKAAARLEAEPAKRIRGVSGLYYEPAPLGRTGKVAVLFPGEGSQYPGMLAELCLHFPEVRHAFDQVDRIYAGHPRGHVTSDWVYPRPSSSEEERRIAAERLMQMDIAVEAVLTANAAMHALFTTLGVRADVYVGHSTGELSAAMATGVLALADHDRRAAFSEGLYACYAAAESSSDVPRAVLLAVGAGRDVAEAIAAEVGGDFMVAMDNCPHQAVLVGDRALAERARAVLAREGLVVEELPYDRAVHTPRFSAFASSLRRVFEELGVHPPTTPLWSCTTVGPYPDDPDAIRELMVEHWTSPVEFRRTVEALYDDGVRVFVECGPRGNLTAFVEDVLRGRDICAVAADVPRRTGTTQLNHLVAMLAVQDVAVDVAQLWARRGVAPVDPMALTASNAPAPADGRRSRVDLSLRWPMLRLPDDIAGTLTPRPAPPPSPSSPPSSSPAPPPPPAPAPAARPAPAPARLRRPSTAVMQDHLARMAQLVAVGGQVAQARLARAAVVPPPRPAAVPAWLGDVVEHLPGVELRLRRRIDPTDDVHLDDHRLGGVVPVMPLTMSMALLAEAAAVLVPGCSVRAMVELVARRWLTVADGPIVVDLVARRAADREGGVAVDVELHDGGAEPAVAATVLLGTALTVPPNPTLDVGPLRPSALGPDDIYGRVMFHGPRWQGVRSVTGTGPGGLRATLAVLPLDRLHRQPVGSVALDPVVLDAAGQLVGCWTAEHLDRAQAVFPNRLARVDVYGAAPPVGTALVAAAAVELLGDERVRSDIEVLHPDGRVWLRLAGWEDRRFDLPASLSPLVSGAPGPLSQPWPAAAAGLAASGGVVRRVATTPTAGQALWQRIWSARVLGPDETAAAGDALTDRRRLERLAARTAAKEAVQALLARTHGLDVPLPAIEVEAEPEGPPRVTGPWAGAAVPAPVISLAHVEGTAVAAAAPAGPLGIDVERLRPLPATVVDTAFAPEELTVLQAGPPDRADEWLLRAWCAKEAVAKALGTGFVRSPREVAIAAVDLATGTVEVRLTGPLADDRPGLAATRLRAQTTRDGDLIVATTICEQVGEA